MHPEFYFANLKSGLLAETEMRRPSSPKHDDEIDSPLRQVFQQTWGMQPAPRTGWKSLLRTIRYAHLAGELVTPHTVETAIICLEQSLLLPLGSYAKPWGGLA